MKKLSKKKQSLIAVGIVAVLAVSAAAYVHYHRPASSSTSQGVKPDTSDTTNSDGTAKTPTETSGVTPTPIPAPTAEGKPQSEATNPNPSGLTVTLTMASAANGGAAIINKVASGSCLFTFTMAGHSPEQATTLLGNPNNLGYSSCTISVDNYVGWTVQVTATVDGTAVKSNSMVVTN